MLLNLAEASGDKIAKYSNALPVIFVNQNKVSFRKF